MKVVVTGSSCGMGLEIANKFLSEGHEVVGIDVINPTDVSILGNPKYTHLMADVSDKSQLPDIEDVNILINNAGVQGSGKDIDINLKGLMNTTEKYALGNSSIRAVVNQAAASAHMGTDYPEYVASKAGVIGYTKWVAKEIAQYGATCNSLSFGGVLTEINKPVTESPFLWNQVMQLTPLKQWTTVKEVANWVYFIACLNRSCSGQDIVIDNLESLNGIFVWV